MLILAGLLILGSAVILMTRPPEKHVPPWVGQSRSKFLRFIDGVLHRGPQARSDRNRTNLLFVRAYLSEITRAQAQFRALGFADEDRDGTGEYGTFAELGAALPIRGTDRTIDRARLFGSSRVVSSQGCTFTNGHAFKIFLPGPGGRPVGEAAGGGIPTGTLDPDLAEVAWFCVVRPIRADRDGDWSYLITEGGDMYGMYGKPIPEEAARFDIERRCSIPNGDAWILVE